MLRDTRLGNKYSTTSEALQEFRCRQLADSLYADWIASELHAQLASDTTSRDPVEWDELSVTRRGQYEQAGELAVRSMSPSWRRVALDRAADALAEHLPEMTATVDNYGLAIGRPATQQRVAQLLRIYAEDVVGAYLHTLTGLDPLSDDEQVDIMQESE